MTEPIPPIQPGLPSQQGPVSSNADQPYIPASPQTVAGQGLISPNKIYQAQSGGNLMGSRAVVRDTGPVRSNWKALGLDIFSVLAAASFGYAFARYLAGGFSFWFVFGAFLFWGSASVLQGFLQKRIQRRLFVIFLESAALVAFFYSYAWQVLAFTILIIFLCLLWGYFSVRRELRNSIEIRFFVASGRVVGKVVTAAVIFMVIAYAALANNNGNFFISQNGFDVFFQWATGFVNNFYPTLPLNGSVGDFAQAVARIQLEKDPSFLALDASQQGAVLQQSAAEIVGTLASAPGGVATSTAAQSQPASNAFYDYLSGLFARLQEKFSSLFVGAWGVVVFLILRSIGIIAVWITQFVALIFYESLIALGFMKISEQPSTKEVIEY